MNLQQAIEDLRSGNMRPSSKADILSLLEQCERVRDRANPKVSRAGGFGDIDAVLHELLPDDPVIYVDVGASEAKEHSNTWPFYERGGFGLLLEPWDFCWYSILINRPRDTLWPRAIAKDRKWTRFFLCGGCSSLDPTWTKERRGTIMVETEPLSEVLERFPDIRDCAKLLSIDTEGTEEEVLASTDWTVFHPEVVVVEYCVFEHGERSAERAERLVYTMEELGYAEHWRDRLNLVFRRNDL